jgi:transposase
MTLGDQAAMTGAGRGTAVPLPSRALVKAADGGDAAVPGGSAGKSGGSAELARLRAENKKLQARNGKLTGELGKTRAALDIAGKACALLEDI